MFKSIDLPKVQVDYATREKGWQFNPNPELYAKVATQIQKRNAYILLKELGWSYQDDIILDIGCNNGDVTKILLSQFDQIQHITACDILAPCIEYAKIKNADPKISFIELDVCEDWPTRWENRFDKVFSNECFNMISNQEDVLKKVFSSLRPGGELGASYFLRVDGVQNATLTLMGTEKWKKYFQDESKDQIITISYGNIVKMIWCNEQIFPKLLEKIGFKVISYKTIQSWSFTKIDSSFMKGVSELFFKFYHLIPAALQDDFIADMIPIMKEVEMKKFQCLTDDELKTLAEDRTNDKQPLCHELLMLHCVKPNKSTKKQ